MKVDSIREEGNSRRKGGSAGEEEREEVMEREGVIEREGGRERWRGRVKYVLNNKVQIMFFASTYASSEIACTQLPTDRSGKKKDIYITNDSIDK